MARTSERDLRTRLYYDPPAHARHQRFSARVSDTLLPLASALIDACGEWDDAVLWITEWGVWPSHEDWPAYYAARGARGERRALSDTPGHRFDATERAVLAEFMVHVFRNGWDAFVLTALRAQLNPVRVRLSHDEWIEVQSDDGAIRPATDV